MNVHTKMVAFFHCHIVTCHKANHCESMDAHREVFPFFHCHTVTCHKTIIVIILFFIFIDVLALTPSV